jgi:hypothetical protein
MSVHNIREQLENVLVKLGLVPKPKEIIIKTKKKEYIICSEKD